MSIRRAVFADAEAIADVHVRSWQGAYRGVVPQDFLDALDPRRRRARRQEILSTAACPMSATFVAEQAGAVVGFADTCPSRDIDAVATGELAAIYVLPEAWGLGFGRELVHGALANLVAAGCAEATLWVLAANARARRFYQAGGWNPDGAARTEQVAGASLAELRYRRRLG